MTNFPRPSDPLTGLTRADGTSVRHSFDHGRQIDDWLNVKYFGAKGDGSTDDTQAIQDALDAVLRPTSDHFTKTLYFPWTEASYKFAGASLNWYAAERVSANDRWVTLRIDGKLLPTSTITIPARRFTILGGSSGRHSQFGSAGYTEINGSAMTVRTDPIITWSEGDTTLRMKGFIFREFRGNGILSPGGQPDIYLKNVFFRQDDDASGDYSCVKVEPAAADSFNLYFESCGFDTQTPDGYGLELWDVGLVTIDKCHFNQRGIFHGADEVAAGAMSMRDVLAESLDHALLTLDSQSNPVQGIRLERVENADSTQSPVCLLKNTGTNTWFVTADNCGGYTRLVESGSDYINALYQKASHRTSGTTVGQARGFERIDEFGRHYFGAPVAYPATTKTDNDTTPTAGDGTFFVLSNVGATSITNFDNPVEGEMLYLLFTNANTTIVHGTPIKLAAGANFVGSANDMLTLISDGTTWYEISRSVNG
jgi:hypothetical protein